MINPQKKKKRYFYLAFLAAINTEKAKGIISQQATRVLIHGVPRQRDSSFFDHVIFFISGLLDFVFPSSFLSIFLKTIRFLTIQYGFFLAIIVAKFSREKRQSKILLRLLKIHRMQGTIKNIFSIYYLVKKEILRKKLLLKKSIISLSKLVLKIFENIYIFFVFS